MDRRKREDMERKETIEHRQCNVKIIVVNIRFDKMTSD